MSGRQYENGPIEPGPGIFAPLSISPDLLGDFPDRYWPNSVVACDVVLPEWPRQPPWTPLRNPFAKGPTDRPGSHRR